MGLIKAMSCQQRLNLLETLKIALVTLKQRLIFTLASPEELLQILTEDERFKKCEIISLANLFAKEYGFEKGWKKAAEKQQLLNAIEIDTVNSVADILGKSDLETQVKQLEIVIEQLNTIIFEQKNRINENKKLYITLGILSSLVFAVMLI